MLSYLQPRQHYAEFHPEAWITQPWNAWTSAAFLLPALYWAYALRGMYRRYFVLIMILPLAVANGIGSFLWHAQSGGSLNLQLDIYPPRVMLAWLGVYFCRLIFRNWVVGFLVFIGFAFGVLEFKDLARPYLDVGNSVSFNYIVRAAIVIVPVLLVIAITRARGVLYVVLTLFCLGAAIWFRNLDWDPTWQARLPQGTHFLWHLFCALAYLPLGRYIIALEDQRRERKSAGIEEG